jgi:16S rRNA (guanine966-N2)-methyltransferase
MKRGIQQVRIIGGTHRGRKVSFPELPGLRPTPDRVRETLFNWLSPHISGMRVLDLFAGSGALGVEALSRGAASALFVESQREAVAALEESLSRLDLRARGRVERGDGLGLIGQMTERYDLIFVDPPFADALWQPALRLIAGRSILAPGGFCYVECPRAAVMPPLPEGWVTHRSGTAGEVGYHLLHEPQCNLPGDV